MHSQIGLLFFLAGVGIRAGYSFAQTLRQNGPAMLLAGAVVTLVITQLSLIVGYKCLKIPFASLMGLVSGIQTTASLPGLRYARSQLRRAHSQLRRSVSGDDDRKDHSGAVAELNRSRLADTPPA